LLIRYKTLCVLAFFHKYYGETSIEGFSIVPLPETVKIMFSNGLLLKEVAGQYYLLEKEDQELMAHEKRLGNLPALRFLLKYKDANVFNISDIDMPEGNVFFLSNAQENTIEYNSTTLLQPSFYLTESERIRLVQNISEIDTDFSREESVSVKNKKTRDELFSGTLNDFLNSFKTSEIQEIGSIEILTDKQSKEYFVASGATRNTIGLIELKLEDQWSEKRFGVQFNSRSAIWRYNLISQDKGEVSDFRMFLGKNQLMVNTEERTLGNGQSAFSLSIAEPLALQRRYDQLMELEFSKQGSVNSKRRITLPTPEVDKVKVFKTQEGVSSLCDMYIYL
jgi:hypothetical protein